MILSDLRIDMTNLYENDTNTMISMTKCIYSLLNKVYH